MAPVVTIATAQDFLDYAGALPPYRSFAWAARLDGRIIGIGGVLLMPDGGRYAFLDVNDEARKFPHALHRAGLRFMDQMRHANIGPIVATTMTNVPRANEWLLRLGFTCHDFGEARIFIQGGPDQSDR